MGYNTDFDGRFEIRPPLSDEALAEAASLDENEQNLFHKKLVGLASRKPYGGWCDWEFHNERDCTIMQWNGSEKSYDMETWAAALQKALFPKSTVTGKVRARGEEFDDLWEMVVDENGNIVRRDGWS